MSPPKTKKTTPWVGICLSVFVCALLILPFVYKGFFLGFFSTTRASSPLTEVAPSIPEFKVPPIEARAVVVYDLAQQRELYAQNPEAQLPLASLAKVMTALVARELLGKEVSVSIGEKTLKADGDGLLKPGEKWRLSDLLEWTLIRSSNDGALAIANTWESVAKAKRGGDSVGGLSFVEAMNSRSRELGLTQTYFLNETGLDLNTELPGAYGSARDMTKLLVTAVEKFGDSFEATRYETLQTTTLDNKKHKTKNTNKEAETIPGIIASKTGFTDLSGGNLALLFDVGPNHPIAIIVLGSSSEGRFEDMDKLIRATLLYLKGGE